MKRERRPTGRIITREEKLRAIRLINLELPIYEKNIVKNKRIIKVKKNKVKKSKVKKKYHHKSKSIPIVDVWRELFVRKYKEVECTCYIIKCWNDTEVFYKVGITHKTIKERFHNKKNMPYNYEVKKVYIGTSRYVAKLEHDLHDSNKENKYRPKIYFSGISECFIKVKIWEYLKD